MIGATISHYKILEKLGEGGMGVVYKAQDTKLDRHVALKFLPSEVTASEEERARFAREAKAVSALDHPNICTVYEADTTPQGQMFIAMAYYDGSSLNRIIEKGRLGIEEALRIAIQVSEGLQAAHEKKIVHRDVKPGNIIVTTSGQVKLVDFGLASQIGRTKLTRTHATIGTAAYMAPEQATGEGADHRSDLWSLGVVLYEMLTGHLPFRGEHEAALMYSIVNEEPKAIEETVKDASAELVHVVRRTLEKDPAERYQSVTDMLIDLRRLKKDTSRSTYASAKIPGTVRRAERRKKKVALISGVIGLMVLAGVVLFLWPRGPRLNPTRTERILDLPFQTTGYPSISADGKWMIIPCLEGDRSWKLYHVNVSDATYRKVADEQSNHARISPDGSQIAFQAAGTIRIISVNGGASRLLADSAGEPFWTKDGAKIGYRVARGDRLEFRSVNVQGGEKQTELIDTLSSSWNARSSAAWSPDGGSIAYIHTFNTSLNDVFVFDTRKKTIRRLTNDNAIVDEISWSENDMIVFSSTRRGVMQLWAVPAEGGDPQQITSGEGMHTAPVTGGTRLVHIVTRAEGELWIANIDSGTVKRLNLNASVRLNPAFSPDGNKIVVPQFVEDGSLVTALSVIDLVTQQSQQILAPKKFVFYPTWSPDGKWIAFGMLPIATGADPWLSRRKDSILCCVMKANEPGSYKVVGRGIPRQWIDERRFVAERNLPGTGFARRFTADVDGSRQTVFFRDSVNAYPVGRGYVGYHEYGEKLGRVFIVKVDPLFRPAGDPRIIPGLDMRKYGHRSGVHPGYSWSIVSANDRSEWFMLNLLTGQKKSLPATVSTLLVDTPGANNVILAPNEREFALSKRRATTKIVVTENLFE